MNRIRVVTIALITVAALLSSGHGLAQTSPPCANNVTANKKCDLTKVKKPQWKPLEKLID